MYRIARPINNIPLNGNEYVLDDDRNIRLFAHRSDALELLEMTEEDLAGTCIEIEEVHFPFCEAVQKVILERTYIDPDEYEGHLGLVLAAYQSGHGCVNDAVWDTTELDQSIIRKFSYALLGVFKVMGIEVDFTNIVVEPTHEDKTYFIVKKDDRILLDDSYKAWSFGGSDLFAIEEFFKHLSGNVNVPPEEKNMKNVDDDHIRVFEKSMSVEGHPAYLKLISEALDGYALKRGIDLPKTVADLVFNIDSAYQTHNDLDQDDWDMTDSDKARLGLEDE